MQKMGAGGTGEGAGEGEGGNAIKDDIDSAGSGAVRAALDARASATLDDSALTFDIPNASEHVGVEAADNASATGAPLLDDSALTFDIPNASEHVGVEAADNASATGAPLPLVEDDPQAKRAMRFLSRVFGRLIALLLELQARAEAVLVWAYYADRRTMYISLVVAALLYNAVSELLPLQPRLVFSRGLMHGEPVWRGWRWAQKVGEGCRSGLGFCLLRCVQLCAVLVLLPVIVTLYLLRPANVRLFVLTFAASALGAWLAWLFPGALLAERMSPTLAGIVVAACAACTPPLLFLAPHAARGLALWVAQLTHARGSPVANVLHRGAFAVYDAWVLRAAPRWLLGPLPTPGMLLLAVGCAMPLAVLAGVVAADAEQRDKPAGAAGAAETARDTQGRTQLVLMCAGLLTALGMVLLNAPAVKRAALLDEGGAFG